jgi:outer membrane protein TolC
MRLKKRLFRPERIRGFQSVVARRVALTQAQVNRLSALYRYEVALAELERAAGCPPGGRLE